jgi:hypothetical protein
MGEEKLLLAPTEKLLISRGEKLLLTGGKKFQGEGPIAPLFWGHFKNGLTPLPITPLFGEVGDSPLPRPTATLPNYSPLPTPSKPG